MNIRLNPHPRRGEMPVIRFDAAVAEFHWLLKHVVDVDEVLSRSGIDGFDRETTAQLLDAAGEFIGTAIAPLNEQSDRVGARMQGGRVVTPPGWRDAYEAWRENGWPALGVPPTHGGQGM